MPFGIELDWRQVGQLSTYLDLLLRWNEKIHLTSIRGAEKSVTRHFGESLFLSGHEKLQGHLLDVGSGAGFPGLALKIALPDIQTTLLEPITKKRAFLKEVIRACEFEGVEVRPERLEGFRGGEIRFCSITMRAVGSPKERITEAWEALANDGKMYLWLSRAQRKGLNETPITWFRWLDLPMSRDRGILMGTR